MKAHSSQINSSGKIKRKAEFSFDEEQELSQADSNRKYSKNEGARALKVHHESSSLIEDEENKSVDEKISKKEIKGEHENQMEARPLGA